MRVEAQVLALALALSTAPAAQASPCDGGPAALARGGAGQLGPSGPHERRLDFHLAAAGLVWAEAEGVEGTAGEDPDSAPEVFLDDRYLGPLTADSGADWRSPEALTLLPGPHQLLLRSAEDGEGPLLRWQSLRVMGEAPCAEGSVPAASARRSRRPAPALPAPCGKLRQHAGWLGPAGGLDLQAVPGRFVDSGPLVRLDQGETWTLMMKIPAAPGGGPLPLLVRFAPPSAGKLHFLIWVDKQFKGRVGAVNYSAGLWQPLTLSLCSEGLRLRYAQEPPLLCPGLASGLTFEVAARDLDLALAPAP
ncbi:MAG TPA: hypothetical protein VK914_00705 [bacterium]|jgi:hypothetical protein|nr:hypothetical protein [bacterium]